jgi:predicted CopG family antitoxin
MSKYKENFSNISVSNEVYEELSRRRTNPKESMDIVVKRLVNKDVSGYKQDVDLQSKKDLLEKIKRSHDMLSKSFDSLNKEIVEAIK